MSMCMVAITSSSRCISPHLLFLIGSGDRAGLAGTHLIIGDTIRLGGGLTIAG